VAAWLVVLALSPLAPTSAGVTPVFTYGTLNFHLANPTTLTFGPDGRLYVASESAIRALTLGPGGLTVSLVEAVADGQSTVLGIAFDPSAPLTPVKLYASRREPSATDSYEGRVSTYTAPSWTRADVITGLPSSNPYSNHFTNGLAFDPFGRLFIAQGSNTDAGLSGPNWPETPLSAAILTADIHAPAFDGNVTYDPPTPPTDDNVDQTGGDVIVFGAGTRNPYDLLVHSNGLIYATDNGPNGPSTSLTCTTSGGVVSTNDELNLIEEGNYYGFPNRNRGRTDPRQCAYHAPQEGDGPDFTAPIAILPSHCSCDGIAEYLADTFGGVMQGDLIIAQFQLGNVVRADLSSDGRSVLAITTLRSGISQPLDVTVGPTGIIYIAEWGANRVSYLVPAEVGGLTELPSVGDDARGAAPYAAIIAVAFAMLLGLLGLRLLAAVIPRREG
jgi:glucose/arabinose dehydrogenase